MRGRKRKGGNGRQPNQYPVALTKMKQAEFLKALAETGLVAVACEKAGVSSPMPYQWAIRSPSFAKRFDAVREQGEKVLLAQYEGIMDSRICAKAKDPQSALLTMFRTKRLDPRYRDNVSVNVVSTGPVAINLGMDQESEATTSGGRQAIGVGAVGQVRDSVE